MARAAAGATDDFGVVREPEVDVKGSGDVRFKDMIDRFRVFDQPRRPEGKEEEWQGGERVDTRGASILSSHQDPALNQNA